MTKSIRTQLFLFFVLSGFTGLVYQIVWIRMALAAFGVITPFASLVVSIFMLGLALGTYYGGRHVHALADRYRVSPIALYACVELLIGVSAFALPPLFELGRSALLPIGGMGSTGYLLLSSAVITLAMLPWCVFMGATFPTMMAFIERQAAHHEDSFSFLYVANVIGATVGAVATSVVLIELLGFTRTLWIAAAANLAIGLGALRIARTVGYTPRGEAAAAAADEPPAPKLGLGAGLTRAILFITGFGSMALEIVWMRAFTPVLGTLVYAFSGLLAVYLLATWLGSLFYRRARKRGRLTSLPTLVGAMAVTVMLPVVVAIPANGLAMANALSSALGFALTLRPAVLMIPISLLSILPFCAVLGYVTPMLIDDFSEGRPEGAGRAYTVNITGSILGPLAAAYILLPAFGARLSMVVLALPFVALFLTHGLQRTTSRRLLVTALAAVLTFGALVQTTFFGRSFEEGSHIRGAVVRRDHTATVISYGEGFKRHLLVNGYGMTVLTPLTKIMAHLPLVALPHEPKAAVVVAFGMGTTFRSLLSWPIDATAVELVPSVVDAFDYYHDDAEAIRANPRAHIVIDDGRRFLARSGETFDLITIDPPPPVETAGSSMLYAAEFYDIAKTRLAPGGIVQQWFPDAADVEPAIRRAVLRSILDAFPHVRFFLSLHGRGLHILCSMEPIEIPDAAGFVAQMPPSARADLMEWSKPGASIEQFVQRQILDRETTLEAVVDGVDALGISDDRPINEYFLMRRFVLPHQDPEQLD